MPKINLVPLTDVPAAVLDAISKAIDELNMTKDGIKSAPTDGEKAPKTEEPQSLSDMLKEIFGDNTKAVNCDCARCDIQRIAGFDIEDGKLFTVLAQVETPGVITIKEAHQVNVSGVEEALKEDPEGLATEIAPGVILLTKDGFKIGNALVIRESTPKSDFLKSFLTMKGERFWTVQTDFGNITRMSDGEINSLFTLGRKTNIDTWFDDRLEAIGRAVSEGDI